MLPHDVMLPGRRQEGLEMRALPHNEGLARKET